MNDNQILNIIEKEGGNFTPQEFGKDRKGLKKTIIQEIVRWRNWHGFPFVITSAWRETGSHIFGLAIDGLLKNKSSKLKLNPFEIWNLATYYPWMGIGIYFDWNDGVGLHLDLIHPPDRDRPLRWLRKKGHYYYQCKKSGLFVCSSKDGSQIISLGEAVREYQQ